MPRTIVKHDFPMECLGEGCTRILRPRNSNKSDFPKGAVTHAGRGLCFNCYDKVYRRGRERDRIREKATAAKHKAARIEAAKAIAIPPISRDDYWQTKANCQNLFIDSYYDPFFPPKGSNTDTARKLCSECPVKYKCLKTACENEEQYGVWGGHGGLMLELIIKHYKVLKNRLNRERTMGRYRRI